MDTSAALGWANDNAPAITAVATILLVGITAVYVVVTYMLVREQRAQGQTPDIALEFADADPCFADLELRNVGDGTATQLTILRGPGEGIDVDESSLGVRKFLLPGESCRWKIRPPNGAPQFDQGDLPLTMVYLDSGMERVLLEVFAINCHEIGKRVQPDLAGSGSKWWGRREIKRLTAKSMPKRKRIGFWWGTRNTRLSILLLSDEVRSALNQELSTIVQELSHVNQQAMNVKTHI